MKFYFGTIQDELENKMVMFSAHETEQEEVIVKVAIMTIIDETRLTTDTYSETFDKETFEKIVVYFEETTKGVFEDFYGTIESIRSTAIKHLETFRKAVQ